MSNGNLYRNKQATAFLVPQMSTHAATPNILLCTMGRRYRKYCLLFSPHVLLLRHTNYYTMKS